MSLKLLHFYPPPPLAKAEGGYIEDRQLSRLMAELQTH
jgi:hypothetical protein